MGVTPDDQVHAPVRIQQFRQLPVRFDADVGEQYRKIRTGIAVVVADNADLFRHLFDVDKCADELLRLRRSQHIFRKDADE